LVRESYAKILDDCSVDAGVEEKSDGDRRGRSLAGIVHESDIGIAEFISEHGGFSGILKQR